MESLTGLEPEQLIVDFGTGIGIGIHNISLILAEYHATKA